ncbi:hypothetical protein [Flavicella sediminum]|uniref:hypothetical protein n=1 Tax=Flavicella sediminum TaxID=2585141 RepID=UPI001123BB01|nr:hypothetical protein [Flavicella sediminum]
MKKTIYLWKFVFGFLLIFASCDKETFISNTSSADYKAPNSLLYAEVTNVREYAAVKTGTPVLDTDGLIPNFEIISGRSEDGTILDASYMDAVSISNPVLITKDLAIEDQYELNGELITQTEGWETKNSGIIQIADENKFGIGNYYFTVKVTTTINEISHSTVFEDVFHLGVGPQLVSTLLYSPLAQNLVANTGAKTSKPYLITGNPAVTFALTSDTDKLGINSETGVISLKDGYTTTENDTIYPNVQITSTISGETTEFNGEGFLMLVASNTPVVLPKKTNYFFYPTFQAENKLYGYTKEIIDLGSITADKVWIQSGPANIAAAERPSDVTGIKSIFTNPTAGTQELHESYVTINPQDLTRYRLGYNLATVFYIKNQYVEYMPSGIAPTELEIYISTDYTGDDASSTWTKVNDQLSCQINSLDAPTIIGTPYPGDQKLKAGMANFGQDTSKNADAKWVRCEMNLNEYKDVKSFALKFKIACNFTKAEYPTGVKGVGGSRLGRYYISDVHFKASEE